MFRLIVTDYDGTLVPQGKTLSSKFFTKVNMLANRGCIFAVASGRPYNQLKKLLSPISAQTVFIANDGAQMMYKNCVLYKKTVCNLKAKELCAFALDNGLTPIAALREENKAIKQEHFQLPMFLNSDIFKLIFLKNGKDVISVKKKAVELGLRVCFEDDEFLEVCHKDANKGEAVKKLMEKFQITENQMVVFGDGANDVPMLLLTKNCICPETAGESAKLVATGKTEDVEEYILNIK